MSKSDKSYTAVVDLNKLKLGNEVLTTKKTDGEIIPEIKRLLADEDVEVRHPVPLPGSNGYGILELTATGNKPNGFQQRANAAATTALRKTFTKHAS